MSSGYKDLFQHSKSSPVVPTEYGLCSVGFTGKLYDQVMGVASRILWSQPYVDYYLHVPYHGVL